MRLPAFFLLIVAVLGAQTGGTALPGRGMAQHPFLYCGEWQHRGRSEQTMYLVRGGQVVWTYSITGKGEELGDCTLLSNGNIVFSSRFGASEVTPDRKIVWHYQGPPNTEIHTAQPLGRDRVLIMQNGNPAKLLVIHKASGKVEKELILPTGRPENIHAQFRHVRQTKAGTFLAAHLDLGKVVEYDANGNPIWSVPAPSAWAAVRLKNGNTLISGNQRGYLREVNPKGETVWEINKDDLPGITLYTVQEATRLANGNTLINNWSGSLPEEQWPGVVQLIEVTPDKKVVWALRGLGAFRSRLGDATAGRVRRAGRRGLAAVRRLLGLCPEHLKRYRGARRKLSFPSTYDLTTPVRTPAVPALVAAPVAGHDRAALGADRRCIIITMGM